MNIVHVSSEVALRETLAAMPVGGRFGVPLAVCAFTTQLGPCGYVLAMVEPEMVMYASEGQFHEGFSANETSAILEPAEPDVIMAMVASVRARRVCASHVSGN